MFKWVFILSLTMTSSLAWSTGGQDVGNGGDTVTCTASAANSFSGDYFIDYLTQFSPLQQPVPVNSLEESLDRIQNILFKLPWMLASFQKFRSDFLIERDYTRDNIWESASFGLVDTTTNGPLPSLPPANCQLLNQAVIRVSPEVSGLPPEKRVYRYVPELMDRLRKNGPLQVSFLLVHEWLWQFNVRADQNARLNYFLHTGVADAMSVEQIQSLVKNFGIQKPSQLDPWDPNSCVHDPHSTIELINKRQGGKLSAQALGFPEPLVLHRSGSSKHPEDRIDDSDKFKKEFGPHLQFIVRGESSTYIELASDDKNDIGFTQEHLDCAIHTDGSMESSFYCKHFQTRPVSAEFMDQLSISIGSDCVRFYGSKTIPGYLSSHHEEEVSEFVILFRKL